MRFEPYEHEYQAQAAKGDKETLDYFLLRVFETEEVWALKDGPHWFMRNLDGQLTMPVWPYERFAKEAASGSWQTYETEAESLEHVLYNLADELKDDEVMVEIMPKSNAPGVLITADQFVNIIEGMIESGSYSLDQ